MIFETDDFSILVIPKVASAELRRWARSENFNEVQETQKPLYSFWREPESRILSGIATDFNQVVQEKHVLTTRDSELNGNYPKNKKLYHDIIHEWCLEPNLPLTSLTHSAHFLNYCKSDVMPIFFDINDISSVHQYFNEKYSTKFEAVRNDINRLGWIPTNIVLGIIKEYPDAHEYIMDHIKNDTFRPSLLTL